MKRFLMLAVCCLAIIPVAWAQEGDHLEVGAFADYFRSNQTGTNMVGVGGRAGFALLPHTLFEAEMSYDFNQVFSEGFSNTNGGSLTFVNTGVRTLNGLFGPKVEFGHGAVRPFVEVKGGFVNFQFDARPASFDTFTSQLSDLRAHNWNGAVMPGGGIEAKLGPVGLRLDVGDEMYFRNGTHHNLKAMFGPVFRF